MRVGIVSKPEHCKAHAAGLTSDGHSVVVIGGGKNPSVPESVEVLVLRTASCSHAASNVAFSWAREKKRPLIVDNGLSGIRRELTRLQTSVFKDALDLLVESRPGDSLEERKSALRAMGATDGILNTLLTLDPVLAKTHPPATSDLTPNTPYPTSEAWTKQYPLKNIHTGWRDMTRIARSIEAEGSGDVAYLARAYLKAEAFPEYPAGKVSVKATRLIRRHFKGKPVAYALFVHYNTRGKPKTKAVLNRVYQLCTGKGTDTRVSNAAGWYLDEPPALSAASAKRLKTPTEHRHALEDRALKEYAPRAAESSSPKSEAGELVAKEIFRHRSQTIDSNTQTIDSNTKTILGLLDDVELLQSKARGLEAGQLVMAKRTAQQTPDLSSNPFAALDQVKAALKAAGFKGTLTLTIE